MAIAWGRLVTFLPELDLRVPALYSDMTFSVFLAALVGFWAMKMPPLPHTIVGCAHGFGFGEVEYLEAQVAEGVECVIHAQIFVGEAGAGGVGEGSKGFY